MCDKWGWWGVRWVMQMHDDGSTVYVRQMGTMGRRYAGNGGTNMGYGVWVDSLVSMVGRRLVMVYVAWGQQRRGSGYGGVCGDGAAADGVRTMTVNAMEQRCG